MGRRSRPKFFLSFTAAEGGAEGAALPEGERISTEGGCFASLLEPHVEDMMGLSLSGGSVLCLLDSVSYIQLFFKIIKKLHV